MFSLYCSEDSDFLNVSLCALRLSLILYLETEQSSFVLCFRLLTGKNISTEKDAVEVRFHFIYIHFLFNS